MLAPRGMNKIGFGERRGRGQESTACSEDISVMEFYLSTFTLQLRWSIIFIFCVLVLEGMNKIVFWGNEGVRPEGCGLF